MYVWDRLGEQAHAVAGCWSQRIAFGSWFLSSTLLRQDILFLQCIYLANWPTTIWAILLSLPSHLVLGFRCAVKPSFYFFWDRVSQSGLGELSISKAGVELQEVQLHLFSKCWDQSCAPTHPAAIQLFKCVFHGLKGGSQSVCVPRIEGRLSVLCSLYPLNYSCSPIRDFYISDKGPSQIHLSAFPLSSTPSPPSFFFPFLFLFNLMLGLCSPS